MYNIFDISYFLKNKMGNKWHIVSQKLENNNLLDKCKDLIKEKYYIELSDMTKQDVEFNWKNIFNADQKDISILIIGDIIIDDEIEFNGNRLKIHGIDIPQDDGTYVKSSLTFSKRFTCSGEYVIFENLKLLHKSDFDYHSPSNLNSIVLSLESNRHNNIDNCELIGSDNKILLGSGHHLNKTYYEILIQNCKISNTKLSFDRTQFLTFENNDISDTWIDMRYTNFSILNSVFTKSSQLYIFNCNNCTISNNLFNVYYDDFKRSFVSVDHNSTCTFVGNIINILPTPDNIVISKYAIDKKGCVLNMDRSSKIRAYHNKFDCDNIAYIDFNGNLDLSNNVFSKKNINICLGNAFDQLYTHKDNTYIDNNESKSIEINIIKDKSNPNTTYGISI